MARLAPRALRAALALLLARPPLGVSFLSPARRASAPAATHSWSPKGRPSCSALVNKGTYFAVDIEVGSPGQRFSVVADTGSNTLLVPHCFCQETGYCDSNDRCFTGVHRSRTFSMARGPDGPQTLLLSYGSGQVVGVVGRDRVKVGQLEVFMKDGILLMVRKALKFSGSFEGILGLGIPRRPLAAGRGAAAPGAGAAGIKEIVERIKAQIAQGREATASALGLPEPPRGADEEEPAEGGASASALGEPGEPGGFLEQAGVGRFSICFNDGGADGVLQLGTPPLAGAHGSVGEVHWGVGLAGVSVGNSSSAPLRICRPENMSSEQQTPCGAIPDSGTTAIIAPKEELEVLLGGLCDEWPRCRDNHTALVRAAQAAKRAAERIYGVMPFDIEVTSKARLLEFLLEDCEAWLDEAQGLSEMPDIHFHVTGSGGTRQVISLPASTYVFEAEYRHKQRLSQHLEPVGNASGGGNSTSDPGRRVCMPGFSTMDYKTQRNGAVWILGTPLFYEYSVGYDLFATPPAVSFTSVLQEPCGSCDDELGLVTTASAGAGTARSTRRPRWLSGPPRLPDLDVKLPL